MSAHKDKLRTYVIAVVGDMTTRSVLRRAGGASIEALLRAELPTVLAEVQGDLVAVLTELGVSFVDTGTRLLTSVAQAQAARLSDGVARLLVGLIKPR